MINRIILSLAVLLATSMAAIGQPQRLHYKNPTGDEFPILAWFSILGDSNLVNHRYQELHDAGFNISFSIFSNATSLAKGLEACRGTGVKIMAHCYEMETNTAEIVNRFKNDENLCGWFLRDEPKADGFAELRRFRDRIASADTTHLLYLNLFPSIVSPADLLTKSYEDYVQRFVDEVALPLVSYDFYPIVDDGKSIFCRDTFFENLDTVRIVARRNGLPFWAFCLSTAHGAYPVPTTGFMSFEAFSALAYGAQGIQYFTYWTPLGTEWDFHAAPIDENLNRTDVYYRIRDINRQIQSQAWVFLGAEVIEIGHTGATLPKGTKALGSLPAPFRSITAGDSGVTVSHLRNGDNRFVMVVSHDINSPQKVAIDVDGGVRQVMPDGTTVVLANAGGPRPYMLEPGGYLIFQYR